MMVFSSSFQCGYVAFDLFFPHFPNRTLPGSTRTMTDSGQRRSSISLPGHHVDFFTFAEHVSFEHSTGSSHPSISSGREGNINKLDKTQTFLDTRSSISLSASPCLCSGAPQPVCDLAGAVTSLLIKNLTFRCNTFSACSPRPPEMQRG